MSQLKMKYPDSGKISLHGRVYALPGRTNGGRDFCGVEDIGPRVYGLYKPKGGKSGLVRVRAPHLPALDGDKAGDSV